MKFRRTGLAAALLAVVLTAALTAPASADTNTAIRGNPLTVHVGQRGQLQAFRAGSDHRHLLRPVERGRRRRLLPRLPGGLHGRHDAAGLRLHRQRRPVRPRRLHAAHAVPDHGQRHGVGSLPAGHQLRREHRRRRDRPPRGDADHDLRQRHPAVPPALERPQRLGQRRPLQGALGGRLLLRRQRSRHRHLHRRPAALHRRHELGHRQLGRLRRGDRGRPDAVDGLPGARLRRQRRRGLGQDRGRGVHDGGHVRQQRERRLRRQRGRHGVGPGRHGRGPRGRRRPPVRARGSQRRPIGTADHPDQRRRTSRRADQLHGGREEHGRHPLRGQDPALPDHRGQPRGRQRRAQRGRKRHDHRPGRQRRDRTRSSRTSTSTATARASRPSPRRPRSGPSSTTSRRRARSRSRATGPAAAARASR